VGQVERNTKHHKRSSGGSPAPKRQKPKTVKESSGETTNGGKKGKGRKVVEAVVEKRRWAWRSKKSG